MAREELLRVLEEMEAAAPPPPPGALLPRLGAFPFWRGPEPLPDALLPVYESSAAAALEVLADLIRSS